MSGDTRPPTGMGPAHAGHARTGHFPPLDGLRGVAILLVLVIHCLRSEGSSTGQVLGNISRTGWIGVFLFFVLSGYLISGILLDCKGKTRYYTTFYARRALRILPIYYAFLLFMTYVYPKINDSWLRGRMPVTVAWPYWAFLSNCFDPRQPLLNPLWSLAVEEHVYVFLPWIIAFFSRRALRWLLVGIFPLALMLRAYWVFRSPFPFRAYNLTPSCLDSFAAGALAAVFVRDAVDPRALHHRAAACAIGSGLVLAGLAGHLGHFYFFMSPSLLLTVGLSALNVFFASIILISVTSTPRGLLNRILSLGFLRGFGRYSFAIYLFHAVIFKVIQISLTLTVSREFENPNISVGVLLFLLAVSTTYVVAWLSWHLLESPFLRLKAFFPYEDR